MISSSLTTPASFLRGFMDKGRRQPQAKLKCYSLASFLLNPTNGNVLCAPDEKSLSVTVSSSARLTSCKLSSPTGGPTANAPSASILFPISSASSNNSVTFLCRLTSAGKTGPQTANATRPSLRANVGPSPLPRQGCTLLPKFLLASASVALKLPKLPCTSALVHFSLFAWKESKTIKFIARRIR